MAIEKKHPKLGVASLAIAVFVIIKLSFAHATPNSIRQALREGSSEEQAIAATQGLLLEDEDKALVSSIFFCFVRESCSSNCSFIVIPQIIVLLMQKDSDDTSSLDGVLQKEGGRYHEGRYVVSVEDDDIEGSIYTSFIELQDGTVYELENLPEDFSLQSGAQIALTTQDVTISKEGTIDVMGIPPKVIVRERGLVKNRVKVNAIGKREVLVVSLGFKDKVWDEDYNRKVSIGIFGDPFFRNAYNLEKGMSACSFGTLRIDPAVSQTGKTGIKISKGVVSIKVDKSYKDKNSQIRNAVQENLVAEFGSSYIQSLEHIMLCIPGDGKNKNAASSDVNGKWSYFRGNSTNNVDVCVSPT